SNESNIVILLFFTYPFTSSKPTAYPNILGIPLLPKRKSSCERSSLVTDRLGSYICFIKYAILSFENSFVHCAKYFLPQQFNTANSASPSKMIESNNVYCSSSFLYFLILVTW